jgi:urea transporter
MMGSTLGTLCGAFMGADVSELAMGLWGYNSALTSMAIGVFFVHSTPTLALSAGGAAATAAVFGAMKTVFGAYGAPALTLPFCTAVSACYFLGNQIPGLQYAKSPHSPEKNSV